MINNSHRSKQFSMVNNYSFLKKAGLMLLFAIVSAFSYQASAQCNITPPNVALQGCVGGSSRFTVTGPDVSGADSIVWTAGTLKSSTATANFTFTSPGAVTVQVTVYVGGVAKCTQSVNFTVNAVPTVDFALAPGIKQSQCYSGNSFTFINNSSAAPGNSMAKVIYLFGDGQADSTTFPGSNVSHTYALQNGNCYDVFMRVIDNKGCIAEKEIQQIACVDGDMLADFNTGGQPSCGTSTYQINNLTQLPVGRVKQFTWDWGDGTGYSNNGSANDTCFWVTPYHTYTGHGCYNVSLFVENDSGCIANAFKANFACNINPNLEIEEGNGRDAQCQTGNEFTFTHNIDPLNWPVQFLWVFDDPDSGPLNFDDQNFKGAQHSFTKPDLYNVSITGNIAGCPFNSTIDVVTKGPGASIENKMIPDLIADSLRHQCQIKDTVYFTNNSSFFLNDRIFMNDTAAGAATNIYKGNIAYLINIPTTYDIDSVEDLLDIYTWNGVRYGVVAPPFKSPSTTNSLVVDTLRKFNNFFGAVGGQRRADHIRIVWDFADNVAPNCTTWTRFKQNVWDYTKPVIHLKDNASSYKVTVLTYEIASRMQQVAPATNNWRIDGDPSRTFAIEDTTYQWMNCRYSRDLIPKHWYTPGEEMCYSVRMVMEDTTMHLTTDSIYYPNPTTYVNGLPFNADSQAVMNNTFIRFGNVYYVDSSFVYPAKLDANGDTVWTFSQFCNTDTIGFEFDLTKPQVFVGFDTTYSKEWLNPNVTAPELKNRGICESVGTVSLALVPPKAEGMKWEGNPCYGPQPTYGVFINWQDAKPGCTQEFVWVHFDSLADRMDNAPLVFNQWQPQQALMLNFITPWPMGTMNMPTWPTRIWKQYQPGQIADSCGWLTLGLRIQNGKNPNTNQPCIDEAWFHNFLRYTPNDSRFTMDKGSGCNPLELNVSLVTEVHDSLVSMAFKYQNTDANKLDDNFSEVDSIYRRKIDPITGDTVNYILTFHVYADGTTQKVDSLAFIPGVGGIVACGSELKLKRTRKFVFPDQGRYAITVTATNTDGCMNPNVDFVVIGFYKDAYSNKQIFCKNETVEFYDTSLYYLKEPDPITGDFLLRWNYWKRPNRDQHPNGDPRDPGLPIAQRERVRWDFDQGNGFVQFSGSPTPNPKLVSYPVPGYYQIKVEFKDSLGCLDTIVVPINVTGASANFATNLGVDPNACKPIVTFNDLSKMYDPCAINTGTPCDSIIRYIWSFGDGDTINTTYTINGGPNRTPVHLYRGFGDYDVSLIVETSLGCFDTITRTISIEGPRPRAEFAIDSVGCVPYTVYLRNLSIDPSPSANWTWYFGDGATLYSDDQNTVSHTYDTPGTYDITLIQEEGIPLLPGAATCVDSFPKSPRVMQVRVLPERPVNFFADRYEICPGDSVVFTDSSDGIYDVFQWIFGDGDTLTRSRADGGDKVSHIFKSQGNYVVRLRPTYTPAGTDPRCLQTKSILIQVKTVEAAFTTDDTGMPIFTFKDSSSNAVRYWWDFGDGAGLQPCPQVDPVNCPNAQHDYGDNPGIYDIRLVVQSPEGCYDTAYDQIENKFEVTIKIPNVFTPNNDGKNDKFEVQIMGWTEYEIIITNRHGEKVFESTDPNEMWNGKMNNTGNDLPAGVYYVQIKYKLRGRAEETYKGTVTLIR
ncbi:MAG: PKD domain-containing protein [Bacteroidetes bacterium]|nr:MAG: PKD domain-containing protein [Bacteroidota bacterium]